MPSKGKQPKKKLDADAMRRLLDAIRDGVTSEDLAGRFGIERSMVQKIARRNGLVLGKGNGW